MHRTAGAAALAARAGRAPGMQSRPKLHAVVLPALLALPVLSSGTAPAIAMFHANRACSTLITHA